MVRKSVPAGPRTLGSLLGAAGLAALVVATAAACGSTAQTAGAGGTSSMPVVTTSRTAPSASASSPAGSTGSGTAGASGTSSASTGGNHPIIPSGGGPVTTPKAQLSAVPSGGKLVAFDSASRSKDGMTLYLGLESQGGACGQYDVVLQQQNGGTLHVGLVHLASGGRVCPMYVTHMLVTAKLSAPLAGGSVVDLANNQVVQAPEVS